jgi:phenylalanyl-tRNA synthetase beta chain
MQFSEAWLRSFVSPPLSSRELSHLLTMAGLEVEARVPAAPPFQGVVVAEVLSVAAHPKADRLRVCEVRTGASTTRQIVCGAPNVAPGQKVPCALPGADLPRDLQIRESEVRGVPSLGMLCGAEELGLPPAGDGLLILPEDSRVGQDIRQALRLDDRLFTLKLTPNRADCLSVRGIAREVAALTDTCVAPVRSAIFETRLDDMFAVRVEAPEACPLYCGRVIRGINPQAATPAWMVERLQRSGLRSISAAVDITNFLLLELGQPLHAFDLGRLSGALVVRMAQPGERLTLLNGQDIALAPDMLVIADAAGPQALAGIMGGAGSGVDETTRDVFLEAAYFSPAAIAGRTRQLGLASDSSHRFERGVDFAQTAFALQRATALLLEICGGEAGPMTRIESPLPRRPTIALRHERVARILGVYVSRDQIQQYLQRLGCRVDSDGEPLQVTPPTYRFDLNIEEDLIEEVARLEGYDRITARRPRAVAEMLPQPESRRSEAALRASLMARDYQEVLTYSFVPAEQAELIDPQMRAEPLANPLSSQLAVMRTGLWGGLLETLRHNLNRQQKRVRIFELGRVFRGVGDARQQPRHLAALCAGAAFPEQWGTAERDVDFFDIKGDLENLPGIALRAVSETHPALHSGQSARLYAGSQAVGWIGSLHPGLLKAFDLEAAPVMFEINLDALPGLALPRHQALPRYPAVRRDLALLVDEALSLESVLEGLRCDVDPRVCDLALFDLYTGKGVPKGKKSLAIRVVIQDTERTMTDADVEESLQKILAAATLRFDAQLR